MNPNKITQPTLYKHCVISPRGKRGFDVFEDSGRWFHVKTQKQAKWWASVHSRLQDEFGSHQPKAVPHAVIDHTPKPKGEISSDHVTCKHCKEVTHLSSLIGEKADSCPRCGHFVF